MLATTAIVLYGSIFFGVLMMREHFIARRLGIMTGYGSKSRQEVFGGRMNFGRLCIGVHGIPGVGDGESAYSSACRGIAFSIQHDSVLVESAADLHTYCAKLFNEPYHTDPSRSWQCPTLCQSPHLAK